MITGNKGEWSELYCLFRLLADGRIYAADANVKKIENTYFPIIKIMREEIKRNKYEYITGKMIRIFLNGNLIKEIPNEVFSEEANNLYTSIVKGGERAFSVADTETFMADVGCVRLAAPSTDKTDIKMQIHDIQTGFAPVCGFSIKSELGNSPTLINATGATNFIFEVKGLSDAQIKEINDIETSTKIIDRIAKIYIYASSVEFVKVNSLTFSQNLLLIDSRLEEMLAYALLYHYKDGIGTCEEVVKKLEENNPLEYPRSMFYGVKFKKFLCAAALGMKPATEWDGIDEANGGYIIVTKKGEVLAYHIYNRNFFEEYLLKQTKFERASTTRHGFAVLYKEEGKIFIKLNLQIRFK